MADPIQITGSVRVPSEALKVKAVRSGGPGGQNVNKVASKVELRIDLALIEGIDAASLERLRARIRNQVDAEGCWIVTSSLTRDQSVNLADAREKVQQILEAALQAPIPRKATRPTRSSQRRRVDEKKAAGAQKQSRRKGSWD